jgi:hypothetical protein
VRTGLADRAVVALMDVRPPSELTPSKSPSPQDHSANLLPLLITAASISRSLGVKVFRTVLSAVVIVVASVSLAPVAYAHGPYKNCSQARADGRHDIPQGDPDYWPGGDRDGDGIACES